MTDESRQLLLDYFMGLTPSESGNDEQILNSKGSIDYTIYDPFLPNNYTNLRIENIIQMPQNINESIIVYGGYQTDEGDFGWILLLDNEFYPIKSFFEYDSGTKLRYIDCMYVDNEGNIYAVDDAIFTPRPNGQMTSEKRFLYLNNFTSKSNTTNDYSIRLIKSYKLIDNNIYCHDIMKSPNSSSFALGGGRYDKDNGQQTSSIIISLKVKVGEENEWKKWVTSGKYYRYGNFYATWSGDNEDIDFKALFSVFENNKTTVYYCGRSGDQWSVKSILVSDLEDGIILQNLQRQVVFMSENEVYFVLTNSAYQLTNSTTLIYKYKDEKIEKLYENTNPYITSYQEQLNLFNINNKLYVIKKEIVNDRTICYLSNEKLNFIRLFSWEAQDNLFIKTIIVRKFNLISYFITNSYMLINIVAKEVNKLDGYNGVPYKDKNSLNSNSGEIYSNGNIVFARNLYNKTLNENTTVSTIEIPNTYLNDIDLTSKNLVSKTNTNIVEDTNVVRKNIYETVFLNFINTVGIAYRTDNEVPLKFTLNKNESTVLNNSINNPTDYNQIKFTKARLNYQDGSNKIVGISVEKQIKDNYLAKITFYVDKEVNNVDWISEDENHVYYVSDVSNCEVGKTYSLDTLVRKGSEINGFKYN